MLEHVLSFLSGPDRLQCRLVCRLMAQVTDLRGIVWKALERSRQQEGTPVGLDNELTFLASLFERQVGDYDAGSDGGRAELVALTGSNGMVHAVRALLVHPTASRDPEVYEMLLVSGCGSDNETVLAELYQHVCTCSCDVGGPCTQAVETPRAQPPRVVHIPRETVVDSLRISLWRCNPTLVRTLCNKMCVTSNMLGSSREKILARACTAGNLEQVQLLCDRFEFDVRANSNRALLTAVREGSLPVVKFLCARFKITLADVIAHDRAVLRACLQGGDLALLEWFVLLFDIPPTIARADGNFLLRGVADSDCAETLEFAVLHFQLDIEDIRTNDNYVLRSFAAQGNLAALEFLASAFSLKRADAQANNNHALIQAASNGHLNVLKFLKKRFGLSRADARTDSSAALRLSARHGHADVVEYLARKFSLDGRDARADGFYALRWACRNGHLPVLQVLEKHFRLSAKDVREDLCCALRWACREGQLPVVEHLVTHFCLGTADLEGAGGISALHASGASDQKPTLWFLLDCCQRPRHDAWRYLPSVDLSGNRTDAAP